MEAATAVLRDEWIGGRLRALLKLVSHHQQVRHHAIQLPRPLNRIAVPHLSARRLPPREVRVPPPRPFHPSNRQEILPRRTRFLPRHLHQHQSPPSRQRRHLHRIQIPHPSPRSTRRHRFPRSALSLQPHFLLPRRYPRRRCWLRRHRLRLHPHRLFMGFRLSRYHYHRDGLHQAHRHEPWIEHLGFRALQ